MQDTLQASQTECDAKTQYKCKTQKCILRSSVNDFKDDCGDNSDERNQNFTCLHGELRCGHSNSSQDPTLFDRCVAVDMFRDGKNDCRSGVDEKTFARSCSDENLFLCLDQSRCLPVRFKCDGIQNCVDGSDEIEGCPHPVLYRFYAKDKMHVASYTDLLSDNKKLDLAINRNRSEVFYEGQRLLSQLMFGLKCVNPDNIGNFFLMKKETVPQPSRSSNKTYCLQEQDKCFTDSGGFTCSQCFDGTIILNDQVCDGTVDCKDLSDECTCENSTIDRLCEAVINKNSHKLVCDLKKDLPEGIDEMYCNNNLLLKNLTAKHMEELGRESYQNFTCAKGQSAKNFVLKLPKGDPLETVIDGGYYSIKSNQLDKNIEQCDRVFDCPFREDECAKECYMLAHQDHNYFIRCFSFLFPDLVPFTVSVVDEYTQQKRYFYNNSVLNLIEGPYENKSTNQILVKKFLADGEQSEYKDKAKNITIETFDLYKVCKSLNLSCPWLFRCESERSKLIEIEKVCDFNLDCEDESDEKYCSEETHFNCTRGSPVSIDKEKVNDDELDCSDRSDECKENPYSSVKEMIKSLHLRRFVWITSLGIIAFNLIVVKRTVKDIKKLPDKQCTKFYNLLFILNLSFSDLILGLVLALIALKSLITSGFYCANDLEWRSSIGCDLVGVFTLLSSQTSLFLLLLLTAFRLYTVYKPYQSLSIRQSKVYFLLSLCWLTSTVVSFIPLISKQKFAQSYVISSSKYLKNKRFERIIKPKDLKTHATRTENVFTSDNLNSIPVSKSVSNIRTFNDWFFNSEDSKRLYPGRSVETKMTFGYYSSSSVCLPDFFSKSPTASQFSLVLLSFNFIIIVLICIGYVFIFYKVSNTKVKKEISKKHRKKQEGKHQKSLYMLVFLIVLTDVLCWLPIIIMSFASILGYNIPEIAHSISSIVLLPINSLLNPIIYSRIELIFKKKLKRIFDPLENLLSFKSSK